MRIDASKSGARITPEPRTDYSVINKSGNSLINHKRMLREKESLQNRVPYISNGYNTDNLVNFIKFDDNNTIDFDKNDEFDLTNVPNIDINNLIATPSTFPGKKQLLSTFLQTVEKFNPGLVSSNKDLIEQYLNNKSAITSQFSKFSDIEYIANNEENYDLINGKNEYDFLDSNLFEQISIDIELENLGNDVILQNSAFIQNREFSNDAQLAAIPPTNSVFTNYHFTQNNNSKYDFRNNIVSYPRLNTPFVMYNFQNKIWEYRGIPNPYQYYSHADNSDYDFTDKSKYLKVIQLDTNNNNALELSSSDFSNFFNKYFVNELSLTNNPINYIKLKETALDYSSNISLPSSLFGFPHFPKFHMFEDNIIKMSKYINKPMIIDKVTVSFLNVDLQSEFNTETTDIELRNGIMASLNFYILNQYKLPDIKFNTIQSINDSEVEYGFKKLIDVFKRNTSYTFNNELYDIVQTKKFVYYDKQSDDNTIVNLRNKHRIINRIFNDKNLSYNSLITSTYVNSKLIINDNIKYTSDLQQLNEDLENFYKDKNFYNSYLREIVTFGNVVFYSKGNTNANIGNTSKIYNESSIDRIKNNCDFFIDTDNLENVTPQNELESNVITYLDFSSKYDGDIKFTTYVKKPSNMQNIMYDNKVSLSSHNINKQFELYDDLNYFKFNEKYFNTNEKKWYEFFAANTCDSRLMTNNIISKHDLINSNTHLISKSVISELESINFDPTNSDEKILNKNLQQSGSINIEKSSNFSPYILTPDNQFGFAFSFSPTISPNIFKQLIKIKKGKTRFTLHGYILKNNQKIVDLTLHNLNQKNITGEIRTNNDFINNSYDNMSLKKQNILNIFDRIYTGNFNRNDNVNIENNINNNDEYVIKNENFTYIKPYNIVDEITISFDSFQPTSNSQNIINISNYFNNTTQNQERLSQREFKRILWNISYNDFADDSAFAQNPNNSAYLQKIKDEGFILLIDTAALKDYIFEIKINNENISPALFRLKHLYNKKNSFIQTKTSYISSYFNNTFEIYKFIGQEDYSFKRLVERKIKNEEDSFELLSHYKDKNNFIYPGSKLLNNLSILPYINFIENKEYLYDDKECYEKIIKSILLWKNTNQLTNIDIYKIYTIAKATSIYKNQKNEEYFVKYLNNLGDLKDSDELFSISNTESIYYNKTYKEIYAIIYHNLLTQGYASLVAALLAIFEFASVISTDIAWDISTVGDKRYLNQYFSMNRYGNFSDLIKQRLYTTVVDKAIVKHVIEQKFIDNITGNEITNFNDDRLVRNKSKNLSLIDAGYKSINAQGEKVSWDGEDFYNKIHILYNDKNTIEFV